MLNTEIRTGTSGYSLFLAANTTTPTGLQGTSYVQSGATAKLYANGIPVLFARYATVSDVATLMPTQSSGVSASLDYSDLSFDQLDTSASQTVAVADPTAAPYGDAAFKILASPPPNTGMGFFAYPPTPSPLPGWMSSPYGNIDLTFQSVRVVALPEQVRLCLQSADLHRHWFVAADLYLCAVHEFGLCPATSRNSDRLR